LFTLQANTPNNGTPPLDAHSSSDEEEEAQPLDACLDDPPLDAFLPDSDSDSSSDEEGEPQPLDALKHPAFTRDEASAVIGSWWRKVRAERSADKCAICFGMVDTHYFSKKAIVYPKTCDTCCTTVCAACFVQLVEGGTTNCPSCRYEGFAGGCGHERCEHDSLHTLWTSLGRLNTTGEFAAQSTLCVLCSSCPLVFLTSSSSLVLLPLSPTQTRGGRLLR